ncbi:glycosyltransferase [Candidatus Saganbacteria bacterium]|nr:glycosyltransferase [Candidatus Saganbacteria bacterium]
MKFSIIIPAYNTGKYIEGCLASLEAQQIGDYEREAVLIDDYSTDATHRLLKEFQDKNKEWVKLVKNGKNLGLGMTRNVGIENATGDWLIFLDADDSLSPAGLKKISEYIRSNDAVDIVGFDWAYDSASTINNEKYGGRWDLDVLSRDKGELIKNFISLSMENSVIYAAMKKDLLTTSGLRFRDGLHEDIDFMLKAYCHSSKCGVLNQPIYLKNNREGSIVNSISEMHIKSFFRALKEIHDFLLAHTLFTDEICRYFYRGALRAVSTEARYIWQGGGPADRQDKLYFMLYDEFIGLTRHCGTALAELVGSFEPKYMMIAKFFLELMGEKPVSVQKEIGAYLKGINDKSWGCYDLYNSLFLTPDEIRTCCKRFFVNNAMKGDVVLLDRQRCEDASPENILLEKRGLHVRTNTGLTDECVGCPYLTFKKWGSINDLRIEYLSIEYNTVCNMRCNYCSDRFYGGKQPAYKVESLLQQLFERGSFKTCRTVMWGGGEPTLDGNFPALIAYMASQLPKIKPRIFTNATVFSETIARLLEGNNILTITSIDAGRAETFYKIRKHKGFDQVFENLKRYSTSRPENMIIKYIITEDNRAFGELEAFASRIRQYSLERCNFQISVNFKEEHVDLDSLIAAIALYTNLLDIGVKFIFFDDLFWQRISSKLNAHNDKFLARAKELDLLRAFADSDEYRSVVIWGAGIQAGFLIEKSAFFKKVKIEYLVDNAAEKLGKKFHGHAVLPPETLLNSAHPVLIAAVQNVPNILDNFSRLGISESRLIKGLVI